MPTESELKERVSETDLDEWEFFDEPVTVVLTPGREIAIEKISEKPLNESWAEDLPRAESNMKGTYRATYRGTPFYQIPFASIDEGRGIIPVPRRGIDMGMDEIEASTSGWYVHSFDAVVGRILSERVGFDVEYFNRFMEQADIEIAED